MRNPVHMESIETPTKPNLDHLATHLPMLKRVVGKRVPTELIEDIVQEVILAGAESNRFPELVKDQQNWLCRVALRQCALFWRKQSRQQQIEAMKSADDPGKDDPIHWLIARESAQQMKLAILKLDNDARRILSMKFVDRLTYDQIASRLQISRHSAEYRVQTAKRELRSIVHDMGLSEVDEC